MSSLVQVRSNILFILHLPPPVHGASQVGKNIQSSKLINQEFNTHFINLATATKINESGKGGTKKIIAFVRIQFAIVRALLFNKFNLCYVTLNSSGPALYKDLLIVIVLKLLRQNLIYHFHNKGITSNNKSRINHLIYRFIFRNSKSILLSPKLAYDIQPYVNTKNVFYCANGISVVNRNPDLRIYGESKVCSLLFLSNMLVEKGVWVLLDACKLLKEKGIPFSCHFVGAWADISEEAFNTKAREDNLTDVVQAHGPKYDKDKLDFFNNADVFVLPTLNEAFPLVLLEAMQHGLAIVSTTEGGITDIVIEDQTGFLVQKKNVEALAQKLEELILNPNLRKKMGTQGMMRFQHLFTIETFERNLTEILKTAICS